MVSEKHLKNKRAALLHGQVKQDDSEVERGGGLRFYVVLGKFSSTLILVMMGLNYVSQSHAGAVQLSSAELQEKQGLPRSVSIPIYAKT